MADVVGGEFEAAALPGLHRKLFIEGQGRVEGMGYRSARLGPGHYLCTGDLGPATAMAVWDVNARAVSLAVFAAGPSEQQTRTVVDSVLALGGSFNTLRLAIVGGPESRSLRSLWMALDKRLGIDPLPAAQPNTVALGPAELYHSNRAYLVYNGAASWLGQPDV